MADLRLRCTGCGNWDLDGVMRNRVPHGWQAFWTCPCGARVWDNDITKETTIRFVDVPEPEEVAE